MRLDCGSDLSADRILSFVTGDAARTITLNGNPTLNDWFDQSVKTTAVPTFSHVITNRLGIVGTYDSGQRQGIWSIGDGFEISIASNNFGTQYGLAYSYNYAYWSSEHEISFVNNGVMGACISLGGNAYFKGVVRSVGYMYPGTGSAAQSSYYLYYTSSGSMTGLATNNSFYAGGYLFLANTSYYFYWDSANTGYRTNANFLTVDIYSSTLGAWLSSWLNQAVKTTSSPTHNNLYLSGNLYPGNQVSYYITVSSSNIYANNNIQTTNDFYAGAMPGTTGYAKIMLVSGWLYYESSSEETKKDIVRDWKHPEYKKFLDLKPIKFKTNVEKHPDGTDFTHDPVEPDMIGFSLEEVGQVGLPGLISYNDKTSQPMALRDYGFTVYHHLILQDHENTIKDLQARIADMDAKIKAIEDKIK
jgi:hypothetical protein